MAEPAVDRVRSDRRSFARLVIAAAVVAVGGIGWFSPIGRPGRVDAASAKITICHRTHSTTNPYRRITVSQNAVTNNHGHAGHTKGDNPSNPDVFDPAFGYAPNNKYWGDVIPGAINGGAAYNGSNSIALNWTDAGQAIFFGSECGLMSAKEFYDVEIAAGVPAADVIADLNEQNANEDAALLAALGSGFTLGNVDSWATAVSVTTEAPTSLSATAGTLNGTVTIGTTQAVSGFQWGTAPDLAGAAAVTADQGTVTGTAAVTFTLTSLTPATTYYYRTTATTDAGLATEGILYGTIVSFTTPASGTTTTTTVPPTTTTTTTVPVTTTTVPVTTTTVPPTTVPVTTTTTVPVTTTTVPVTTTTVPPTTTTTTVPVTTTTVPVTTTTSVPPTTVPPTTTPPTTVPPTTNVVSPLGRLRGVVWFDADRDDRFGEGEAALPGTELAVTRIDQVAARAFATTRFELASSTAEPRTLTIRTGDNGRYQVDDLEPGTYLVTARDPEHGIEPSFDSDGSADWAVTVVVRASAAADADFAAVAPGTLGGALRDRVGRPIPNTEVVCTWAGVDDTVGTDDEADFVTRTTADGEFVLKGVPLGRYSCAMSVVSPSNEPAVAVAVEVTSTEPAHVDITPMATSPVVAPAGEDLPAAGSDARRDAAVAGALVLVGLAFTALGRRRSMR